MKTYKGHLSILCCLLFIAFTATAQENSLNIDQLNSKTSEVNVLQDGTGHTATVKQLGTTSSRLTVETAGKGNSIEATQGGEGVNQDLILTV